MSQKLNVDLEIAHIKNLPPLPEESVRIISAVNDPDVTVEHLVELLSLSPVLVARLIGLANSAFFGRAGKVQDLKTAIIQVLGLNLVKSLALSILLNAELKTSACKNFDAEFFWNHALTTALIAQKFSRFIDDKQMQPNIVYTSGLLLNIGLLAAIYVFPENLNEVFSKSDRLEGSVVNQMCTVIGKNQYDIGAILLERWKLPLIYQTLVKQFRCSSYRGEELGLLNLLELSHWVAVYIVENKTNSMPDLSGLLEKLSISQDVFDKIICDMVENKENIQELANIITG